MVGNICHIFYHDDIDGIMSAAIMLNTIANGMLSKLYPVRSSIRGDKFEELVRKSVGLKDMVIVVDYQYIPRADLWIDHHWDKELGDTYVNNDCIHYNPKAKSTVRVIYDWFKTMPEFEWFLNENMVNSVDMIDSAGYPNIDYVFNNTSPIMVLKAHLEQLSIWIGSSYSRAVELISKSNMSIAIANLLMNIDESVVKTLKESAVKIKPNMVTNGNFVLTEMNSIHSYPRYSEYYVRPDTRYHIRIVHMGGGRIRTDVGYNPWHKEENPLDIGKVLSSLEYVISGGGHKNIGGSIFEEKFTERFIDDLCIYFNDQVDDMEKYAVDENDPVEKKAEEMVKTGQAETKEDAREKTISEKKGD